MSGHRVVFWDPAQDLAVFLTGKDAALIGRETIDDALLAKLPQLRAVSVYGVGFDNIDDAACATRGVALLVAPGVNAAAVAEHTIGLMLAVLRNIARNDRYLHDGIWNKDGGRMLTGKTVGIIGCGAVGSRVGALLRAFSCPLVLNDIADKADLAAEWGACRMSLQETVQSADIITVHVPLTRLTRSLFDDALISLMKPGAVLINTSRGPVVSIPALKKALKSGQLAGAGLDVFESEPIVDKDLFALPGLVGTPHTAGNALEAVEAMTDAAALKLRDYF